MLQLPVTMSGSRPLIHAKINGTDALFLADSGAFFSSLTTAAAQQFNLRLDPLNINVYGVGGSSSAWVTRVKTFTLLNFDLPRVEFVVLPNDIGSGTVGVLGQNVFSFGDVEYDLANGVIRLIRPEGCRNTDLAYWAAAEKKVVSVMDIEASSLRHPHTRGEAYLNGSRIEVMFDTGAATSILTLEAAKHAGTTPSSPGVVPGGYHHGFGTHAYETFIGRFASFKIGDNEEIQNARLRFGEMHLDVDMLLGADFFLSHRIYVATSQRKLYFTYNGGPVFDLRHQGGPAPTTTVDSGAEAPGKEDSPAPAAASLPTGAAPAEPADAEALARRGAASAGRHEYDSAIADFTKAIQMAPTEVDYLRERGMAYWSNRQPELALKDFDSAIALKPEDPQTRMARARLRLAQHAPNPDVAADLEVADRVLPKQHDSRLQMAAMFEAIGDVPSAVAEYGKWIDSHDREDIGMGHALNSRCWVRAREGRELAQALDDCNAALRRDSKSPMFLDSRALVYFKLGQYDRAIADYDAALSRSPKAAVSLYARGVAELRKGQAKEGQADIAAAIALEPHIAEISQRNGVQP